MAQTVSVRTTATAGQIAARTGLAPSSSKAVIGSGMFFHRFDGVDADDAVGYVQDALSPLGALVPEHAVELEHGLL